MTALTNLSLKELATRVVVMEELPTKDLPMPLKMELEALAKLPGQQGCIFLENLTFLNKFLYGSKDEQIFAPLLINSQRHYLCMEQRGDNF